MKKAIVIFIIIAVGVGMLGYPHLATYISAKNSSYATESYSQMIDSTDQKAVEQEWAEAVKYNENLVGDPAHDPFVSGSGMVMQENYYEVLDLGGSMGYVKVPKINLQLSIYHGTSEDALQRGVGHLEGSSMPVGGDNTHTVLTGHTGLSHARMFTDLIELEQGDTFYLHILNQTLAYQVDQIKVVLPDEQADLRRDPGMDYCTLLTCTPYGVNSHRLLVRGVRIPYVPEQEAAAAAESTFKLTTEDIALIRVGSLTAGIMFIIIIIAIIFKAKANRRRKKLYLLKREIYIPWVG
jgi:sortase A